MRDTGLKICASGVHIGVSTEQEFRTLMNKTSTQVQSVSVEAWQVNTVTPVNIPEGMWGSGWEASRGGR